MGIRITPIDIVQLSPGPRSVCPVLCDLVSDDIRITDVSAVDCSPQDESANTSYVSIQIASNNLIPALYCRRVR